MKKNLKSKSMTEYHPDDKLLPVDKRRVLFTYQLEVKDIDLDLLEFLDFKGLDVKYEVKKQ